MTPGIYVDRWSRSDPVADQKEAVGMTANPAPTIVEQPDRGPLSRDEIARLVAADIPAGSYVNLGIGQPTKVADYLRPGSRDHPAHRERHARHGSGGRTATTSTPT